MASQLVAMSKRRKSDLRQLKTYSRKLDAAQEKLEREINRLVVRKKSVPEMSDYQRLLTLADATDSALASFVGALASMGVSWTTF